MSDLTPKDRARRIHAGLARLYPDARCALNYDDGLQLLIATILAAQCTDARVNKITPALFQRYPDAASFATADPGELEALLGSINYFRNKARNVILCCQRIMDEHGGEVPATMDELTALAGVGRKTANVVLGNVYGVPSMVVDTHVGRLSQRMGLTTCTDPVHIEHDLMPLIPKSQWVMFGHRMIYHGRQVCHARKPQCESCTLFDSCARVGVAEARQTG
jgi:endonuclease-3